jgi:hypothetical protein
MRAKPREAIHEEAPLDRVFAQTGLPQAVTTDGRQVEVTEQ